MLGTSRLMGPWMLVRRAVALAGWCVLGLLGASCTTLTPDATVALTKDIIEIKQSVGGIKDTQASIDRKLDYSLNSMNEAIQTRNDALKSSIDDIARRVNDQSGELRQLRAKVEELSFALDSLNKRLNMATVTPGPGDAGGSVGTGGTTGPVDPLLANGLRLFQAGQFREAREAFTALLQQNPPAGGNKAKEQELRYWLGRACMQDNDPVAAAEQFRQAIFLDRTTSLAWEALEYLADATVQQGNIPLALSYLRQIRDNNPNYPDVARVREKISRLESAGGTATPVPTPTPTPRL